MKSVLISIQPKWCELIAKGQKTVEVRKTAPKLERPFKCYIYCTKGRFHKQYSDSAQAWKENALGKVIGEFICNRCEDFTTNYYTMDRPQTLRIARAACLSLHEVTEYEGNALFMYGWHISDLVIYDTPKQLSDFVSDKALSLNDWLYGVYSGGKGAKGNYDSYLNVFRLKRPPQSWCYVKGDDNA